MSRWGDCKVIAAAYGITPRQMNRIGVVRFQAMPEDARMLLVGMARKAAGK